MKIEAFHDIKGFLTYKAFKGKTHPQLVEDLMNSVKQLRFEEAPDYHKFRSLFRYLIFTISINLSILQDMLDKLSNDF